MHIDESGGSNGRRSGQIIHYASHYTSHLLIPGLSSSVALVQYLENYLEHIPLPDAAEWLHLPDVPSPREVGSLVNGRLQPAGDLRLQPNVVEGGRWASKEAYLETHYRLLRADGVTPLTRAVDEVRHWPFLEERHSKENARIYEQVSTY